MGAVRTSRGWVAALLLSAAGFAGMLVAYPAPGAAGSTLVQLLAGSATVARPPVGPAPLVDAEIVSNGHVIATGEDGYVLIGFFDGSTLSVDPVTSVTVVEAAARADGTIVRLAQAAGRTWSSVRRLTSASSRYEITTPAVTASVRGTAFEVLVAADGTTIIRTFEGSVAVANSFGEVLVPAGTQTSATPSSAPLPPEPLPAAPRRSVDIGEASRAVIDDQGRGCGRVGDVVVEQIPGCVVTDDAIELDPDQPAREVSAATAAESGITLLTPPPALATPALGTPGATATAIVPSFTLPPLPTLSTPGPSVPVEGPVATLAPLPRLSLAPLPTTPLAPLPTVTLSPLPTATLAPLPTATLAPLPTVSLTPLPSLPATPLPSEVPSAIPSLSPSVGPLPSVEVTTPPLPTVEPTAVPSVPAVAPTPTLAPLPSVAPTVTPIPLPSPTPIPTPTLTPLF